MMLRLGDLANSSSALLLRRGVAWWLMELRGMVPRRWTTRTSVTTELLLSRGEITVVHRRSRRRPAETVSLPEAVIAAPGDVQGETARAWDQARALLRRGRGRVNLRLDPSLLLETSTTLPMAAERSLRPILQNQLDRLLPLPADAVVFEFSVARAQDAKTITVRLLVATRASIAQAIKLALALGVRPRRIVAAWPGDPPAGGGAAGLVTFWRADQAEGSRTSRRLRRGLELLTVILLVAAYGIYLQRLGEAETDLREQVTQAMTVALRARDLSNEIAQTAATLAVLNGQAQKTSPLALIDELTRLLPDTAWVNQLTIRGPDIEIVGYADRVSNVIQIIEQHKVFGNTSLRAAITPSPDGRGQRFDVGFTGGGRARP